MDTSPFHADELTAQLLASVEPAGAGIRGHMPDQHRAFFASLSYLVVTTPDGDGWPVATMLFGAPGFVSAPDVTTLRIECMPGLSDPVLEAFMPGQEVGVLGLDLATRRRNRANGYIIGRDAFGMTTEIHQSFGNCPQYIQRRSVHPAVRAGGATEPLTALDDEALALIEVADTFFVASRSRWGRAEQGGADISHRGGQPGFVRVDGETLLIPDFRGNHYFNTLGNFLGEPRGALLFIDFERGDLLQLQGQVEIDWSDSAAREIEGAERCWRFRVARGYRRRSALPLRWSLVDQAPTTKNTGIWRRDQ